MINDNCYDNGKFYNVIKASSIITIIINWFLIYLFLTLFLAFISALPSSRVRTISRWPFPLAHMRAVSPSFNNNEKIRNENKITNNKNHKSDLYKE